MKLYTELDAFYDILVWQAPVPFVLALCFASSMLAMASEDPKMALDYVGLLANSLLIWLITVSVLVVLDLLVLPPMFAIMRLGSALVLAG
jgi:hypothetical protein